MIGLRYLQALILSRKGTNINDSSDFSAHYLCGLLLKTGIEPGKNQFILKKRVLRFRTLFLCLIVQLNFKVGESLVGFSHTMGIFFLFESSTFTLCSGNNLIG
jgi:hypothetical protein